MTERERFEALKKDLVDPHGNLPFAGTLLARAAQRWPERTALLCNDETVTYAQLYQRACAVTKTLQASGVTPQDIVCLWYENSLEFFVGYYGIWQTGAVVAPLNVFLHEKELEHIINDARPRALVISDTLLKKLPDAVRAQVSVLLSSSDIGALPAAISCQIPAKDPDALAVLLYTSGTTGLPKGVMISSRNIFTNLMQGESRMQLNHDDRAYMPLPLFHSFAQNIVVWGVFFFGLSAIIIPKLERRFLLQGFAHKPTIVFAVPALYALFCMLRTIPCESVRYFVSGGDALPDKIRSAFALLYGRMICNGYGLTETSPIIAAQLEEAYVSTEVVGKPVYGVECSIRSSDGQPMSGGDVGVLWVKGDNVMMGYYNAPESTAACMQDCWFNTGDLAYLDGQGRIHIVGREKDLIIHKGFNIYPQEVENVLLSHPLVQQAAVVGVADDEGEIPVAWVVVKETGQYEALLKKWCTEHIAPYKIPHKFIICESLPVTSLGKVNKKALKAEYAKK